VVLADLDPELHGLPIRVPATVLGKGEEHGASLALIGLLRVFSKRSSPGLQRLPTVSYLGLRRAPAMLAPYVALPTDPLLMVGAG
jgi:hypothetical protein